MNKKILIVFLVVIVIIIGVYFVASKSQKPTPTQSNVSITKAPGAPELIDEEATTKKQIVIQNRAFTPNLLKVKSGSKVTWVNKDEIGHSATSDNGSFDIGIIAKDKSGSVTFDQKGTYTYHCTPHSNMKGTIIVE